MDADVHQALDLIRKIDDAGGPRDRRHRDWYGRAKSAVLRAVQTDHVDDLGSFSQPSTADVEELGGFPLLLLGLGLVLTTLTGTAYVVWNASDTVVDATKKVTEAAGASMATVSKVVPWVLTGWLAWWLFKPRRPRRSKSTTRTTTYATPEPEY